MVGLRYTSIIVAVLLSGCGEVDAPADETAILTDETASTTTDPVSDSAAATALYPPNANLARWARGTYDYINSADGALRGWERFQLMVHRDGSRTPIRTVWAAGA